MEVKLTKPEILSLYQGITQTISLMDTKEFQNKYKINSAYSLALARNEKLLQDEVKLIQKHLEIQPDKKVDEFEEKRQKLLDSLANKDESGNPVTQIVNGQITYSIPVTKLEKWNEEYRKLEEEYKEVLEKRNQRLEEINKFLEDGEKIPVTIYKIDSKHEQDGIPPSLNKVLLVLFEETPQSKRTVH